jgi:hypothetical protein
VQDAAPAQDKHAAVVRRVKPSDDDDYDFEDIETTKLRHGIKPRQKKVVVGHSWGQIAVGTALSCGQMGCFGALMGLSVGAITGACWACRYLFAVSEHARACAGVRWICRWHRATKTWTLCQAPCSRRLDTACLSPSRL